MKSYINLKNENKPRLPRQFRDDDVRYSESLVEYFLRKFTKRGEIVFDPFAGYGTTLVVAERMKRIPSGIEFDQQRYEYVRSRLKNSRHLFHGDSRQLSLHHVPPFDLSMTSPPYMNKHDRKDPLAAYSRRGQGYRAYLTDIRNIYEQMGRLMKPEARAVIEVSNLNSARGLTTLAWDIAAEVSKVLHFEGEKIICWDKYGYGYDHSYCLIFSN